MFPALSLSLSSGLFNLTCLYVFRRWGQTGRKKYFKANVRAQFGNILSLNDARGNYSLDSFSIYSNLNDMISKACGSYSSGHCGKTKSLFLYTMFGGGGEADIKTRKTTLNFVHGKK